MRTMMGKSATEKIAGQMNNALAKKRNKESGVLGMPHQPVQSIHHEPVFLPGAVKFTPSLHGMWVVRRA